MRSHAALHRVTGLGGVAFALVTAIGGAAWGQQPAPPSTPPVPAAAPAPVPAPKDKPDKPQNPDLPEAEKTKAAEAPPAKPKPAPHSDTPARTPLPPAPDSPRVPWKRYIEIGGDLAFVHRAASKDADDNPSDVRYKPAIGFGLHMRWEIFKYLRFNAYFVDADHEVDTPYGSLKQAPYAKPSIDEVHTFCLGARLSPTLPLSDRARAWVGAGIGWGRLEFGRMTVKEAPTNVEFEVRERADPFVEFPLALGASFDVIPRWLAVEIELVGAFVDDQEGNALDDTQAIRDGRKQNVGGFPTIDASFVQTIGLSLIL